MAELTDRFVYVNGNNKVPLDAYRLVIDLGPNTDRVPYSTVQIQSASLQANVAAGTVATRTIPNFIIKVEEPAMNYYSSDNTGSMIASLAFNTTLSGAAVAPDPAVLNKNVYNLGGYAPELVFGGQLRYLTLYIEDSAGERQQLATIPGFTMCVKASYPRVGLIQEEYRKQIPL